MYVKIIGILLLVLSCTAVPAYADTQFHDLFHDLGHLEVRDGVTQINSPNVQIIVLDVTFITNGVSWESSYATSYSSGDDTGWIDEILAILGI